MNRSGTKSQPLSLPVPVELTHATSDSESTAEEEWLERDDHPLLNVLILETLFGLVRRCDLKFCRVVCKRWNLCTIPHMRATFKVTIYETQPTEQNDAKTHQNSITIDNFVELFSSNELGIPFAKFQLGPFCMADGVGKQFLEICAETATDINLNRSGGHIIEDVSELLRASPNIQALTIPQRLISRSENVVKLFPDSLPTFSSLKKITFSHDYPGNNLKCCPTFLYELFGTTPNISDIYICDNSEKDGTNNGIGIGISAVLNSIEKLGMESSIQSLALQRATILHIEQLCSMGEKLALKRLELSTTLFVREDIDVVQRQLAVCFKDTLQHFYMDQSVDNNFLELPYMPHLKSLTSCSSIYPKTVNLNKTFPVLQTFKLFPYYNSEDWDGIFSIYDSCPTVTSLSVYDTEGTVEIYSLDDIIRVFPNLTELSLDSIHDCEDILRQMWSHMTGLESLSLHGCIQRLDSIGELELDSLFTGVPTEELKGLTDVVNSLEEMTAEERRETIQKLRNEHCRIPSIVNLTKLRRLHLDLKGVIDWTSRSRIHLSNATAYLALYSMNQINHLVVVDCLFTKTSCDILTKETELCTWTFRNKEFKYIIPPFYH